MDHAHDLVRDAWRLASSLVAWVGAQIGIDLPQHGPEALLAAGVVLFLIAAGVTLLLRVVHWALHLMAVLGLIFIAAWAALTYL